MRDCPSCETDYPVAAEGQPPFITQSPVLINCLRMARACNERPVPTCLPEFRSGDGPAPSRQCNELAQKLQKLSGAQKKVFREFARAYLDIEII